MTQEKENNGHYSDQTGHLSRGQAARIRRNVERQFPGVPFMPPDIVQDRYKRRKMRRVTRDGR